MQKQEKRLIKRTIIPVRIEDNPRQLRGLIRFSTEPAKEKLHPLETEVVLRKSQVLYKNQILRQEEGEEEEKRKKEMEMYEVSINPEKFKNKQQFKVEIPIVRGPKSLKNSKANDLYFTFYYSGSEGKMALQNGYYEAKKEIVVKNRRELSMKEKLEIQMAKLDNRRKGDIDEPRARRDDDSDDD